MPTEQPCLGKLTKLMADHFFRDVHIDMRPTVVYQKRMAYKFRRNCRATRPSLYWLFFTLRVQFLDLGNQASIDVGTFFQ